MDETLDGAAVRRVVTATSSRSSKAVSYVGRRFRALLGMKPAATPPDAIAVAQGSTTAAKATMADLGTSQHLWLFGKSGYAILTVLLYILVNRIHRLVPPRRLPLVKLSPLHRLTLRLPSLLLLLRSIVQLSTVLLNHSELQLGVLGDIGMGVVRLVGWLTSLAGDINGGDQSALLWSAFIAVVVAIVTEAFVRSLDDDLSRQTNFNLVSFSYFCHSQSQPLFTTEPFSAPLYLYLFLTLAELFSLHLASIFTPPYRSKRFPITAVFSILNQIFVGACMLQVFSASGKGLAHSPPWQTTIWLTRLGEVASEALILSTVFLKLFAALCRRDPITMETVFGHSTHYPRFKSDYSTEMINYALSCLQTTRLSGYANEVAHIPATFFSPIAIGPPVFSTPNHISYVGLSRGEGSGAISEREPTEAEQIAEGKRKGEKGEGLGNEIFHVDALPRLDDRIDPMGASHHRTLQSRAIVRLVFRISFYLLYVCYQAVRRLEHRVRKKLGWRRDSERLREEWRAKRDQDGDDEEDEDFTPSSDESDDSSSISEEEEGDEEEQFDEEVPSSILYTDLATSPSRNHHQLVSSSVASTSRNRLSSSPVFDEEEDHQADLSSIVLAHHTTTSASPLTRRRYHDLVRHHSASSGHGRSAVGTAFDEAISDRRREVVEANLADDGMARRQKERWEDGRQRLCLVCTMEERNIILWPCRCLAICDDCRENLAERTAATSHLCPTCRSVIQGFSRLYIP